MRSSTSLRYSDYSDLADFESAEQQLELWIEHTQDLIDLVREFSPETLVASASPRRRSLTSIIRARARTRD